MSGRKYTIKKITLTAHERYSGFQTNRLYTKVMVIHRWGGEGRLSCLLPKWFTHRHTTDSTLINVELAYSVYTLVIPQQVKEVAAKSHHRDRQHAIATGHITAKCQDFCRVALCARSMPQQVMLPGCGEAAGNVCGKDKSCSQ